MQPEALTTLRCPTCLGTLRPVDFGGSDSTLEAGLLLCDACATAFPVQAGVPVLLRFATPFHSWFASRYAAELAAQEGHSLPSGTPRPGEEAVQETFTDEWSLTSEDDLSFSYSAEQLIELNRRVWLKWLDDVPEGERPNSLLNVGCGAGMETIALREVTGARQIFAVDLNFALLDRRPEFRDQPGITFVVCSLFDLPFETASFDMVYSQGVLHHTHSTEEAFRSVAPRTRPGGHLFVWVYGLDDHLTPSGSKLVKRRHHLAEHMSRPLISRAPRPIRNGIFKVLSAVAHLRPRGGHARQGEAVHGDRWSRLNTEHALRDWLSPRYARRHGYVEVTEWFEDAGFAVIDIQSASAYRELFGTPMFGVGMTGRRLEGSPAGRERAAESSVPA